MNKVKTKYDVFISYRREGGQATAVLFYERLSQLGYRVAYDIESLKSGVFDEQILNAIRECRDVLVVLSPNALEKCADEDDWVRQEIACAFANKKNVVPLMLRGFEFPKPEELPEDIRDLPRQNGVGAAMEHFDSTFERVRERLLSRPRRRAGRLIAAGAAALILGVGAAVGYCCRDKMFPFPYWQADKQRFSEIKELATRQISSYCLVSEARAKLVEATENVAQTDLVGDFQNELARFNHAVSQVDVEALKPSDRVLDAASRTPIEAGDVKMFWEMFANGVSEAKSDAAFLEHAVKTRKVMSKGDFLNLVRTKKTMQVCRDKIFAYEVMGLFSVVDESALADIKKKMTPMWKPLDELSRPWLRSEADITSALDKLLEDYKAALSEMAAITGKMNLDLRQEEAEYAQLAAATGDVPGIPTDVPKTPEEMREQLEKMGATPEQIEQMMEKLDKVMSLKRQFKDSESEIAAAKEEAHRKFAPNLADEPRILWGKAQRFLSLDMKDDALLCVAVLRRKQSPDFPDAACNSAEAFIRSRGRLPFAAGVMATRFEPPATSHAIYQIGDIIVAQDGKAVTKFDDYHTKVGSVYTVYRYVEGALKKLELTMPENQPRVLLVELMENLD